MKLTIIKTRTIIFSFVMIAFCSLSGSAQHRGDNLSFQGLENPNNVGVKALAMGGAYTSIGGDLNALFYNPAGLIGINGLKISISANSYQKSWQENQIYRPNRFFVTLPYYLEGYYVPDPANNGIWDYELAADSNYYVSPPELGQDEYSKDAADWLRDKDDFGFTNLTVALPVDLLNRNFVFAASYRGNDQIWDYDRNDTYLDPHLGYNAYGNPERVDGTDTVYVNWSRFIRKRTGKLSDLYTAVALDLSEKIKLGAGVTYMNGETDDLQSLDRIGKFGLFDDNEFFFSYDTLNQSLIGKSKFRSTRFNIGAILKLNNFNLGLNINLPYTYTREWEYTQVIQDTLGSANQKLAGTDKFKVPASFALGMSFSPMKQFVFSLDFENKPFGKSKFELASGDSTHRSWVDVKMIRVGVEYRPTKYLSLLAGYRNLPTSFVPDGAAFRDRGSNSQSYTIGASLSIGNLGCFDYAYEIRRLKYYDSYYSNTNYVYESLNRMFIGYTYSF